MRRLLCTAFGHRRDSKKVRPSRDGWRAPCLNCAATLVRIGPGDWKVASDILDDSSAAERRRQAPFPPRKLETVGEDELAQRRRADAELAAQRAQEAYELQLAIDGCREMLIRLGGQVNASGDQESEAPPLPPSLPRIVSSRD